MIDIDDNTDDLSLSFIAECNEPGPLGHYVNYWTPVASDDLVADIARGSSGDTMTLESCTVRILKAV